MKFAFKIIVMSLTYSSISAREIIVLTYKNESSAVAYLKQQLIEDVSKKLVSVKESDNPCEDIYRESILHICFNQNDEMRIVRQNVDVLKKTISKM